MAVEIHNPTDMHAELPKPLLGTVAPQSSIILPTTKEALDAVITSWDVPQGPQLPPTPAGKGNNKEFIPYVKPIVTFTVTDLPDFKPQIHCRKCAGLFDPGTEKCTFCTDGGNIHQHYTGEFHTPPSLRK